MIVYVTINDSASPARGRELPDHRLARGPSDPGILRGGFGALTKGLLTFEGIRATIGEVVAGKVPGRIDDQEITVFDSTGLAIQDVATATKVHQNALKKGIGTKLSFL